LAFNVKLQTYLEVMPSLGRSGAILFFLICIEWLDTVPFESIRQSRVTDPCVGTKFELCHGSWGRFVELIFHVTNHSNCLEIVEEWVEATKKIPHLTIASFIIIGGNSVQIPDILDENFGCVTVTKPGCRTDESVRHVTGHRVCRIDSNGTVT